MKLEIMECKRCGIEIRRKRLAQVYCGLKCSDAAKKARRRKRQISAIKSGDAILPRTPLLGSGDAPILSTNENNDLDALFLGGMGLYQWPAQNEHHGPTPGALQGDDYPLEYYPDAYPKLPEYLKRKPKLAQAA